MKGGFEENGFLIIYKGVAKISQTSMGLCLCRNRNYIKAQISLIEKLGKIGKDLGS